jgi:hypothetical protein
VNEGCNLHALSTIRKRSVLAATQLWWTHFSRGAE